MLTASASLFAAGPLPDVAPPTRGKGARRANWTPLLVPPDPAHGATLTGRTDLSKGFSPRQQGCTKKKAWQRPLCGGATPYPKSWYTSFYTQ